MPECHAAVEFGVRIFACTIVVDVDRSTRALDFDVLV
jgi:hypothetical protein